MLGLQLTLLTFFTNDSGAIRFEKAYFRAFVPIELTLHNNCAFRLFSMRCFIDAHEFGHRATRLLNPPRPLIINTRATLLRRTLALHFHTIPLRPLDIKESVKIINIFLNLLLFQWINLR